MTTRKFQNGLTLHEKISRGADVLADNVASTLGPKGRNVILQQLGKEPFITKDGVTIAKFVALSDYFENAAAQILKQAASKTNDEAGDGTTTSTVLARALLRESQKYLRSGVSPTELQRGMIHAGKKIVEFLATNGKSISSKEDLAHVATVSANGDSTIGNLIATAIDQAGKNGSVTIEEARSVETSLDMIEGFIFNSGYLSNHFITDERKSLVSYEDCLILVTDHKLESVEELLPLLEKVAREGKPLLIVADEIEGQLLAALIMNSLRGSMKVVAVKAPYYGEERRGTLEDLALAVGGQFVTRESGVKFQDIGLVNLGKAKNIVVTKKKTTIAGGAADHKRVQRQIEILKEKIKEEDSMQICEKHQERITRLASGVAVIRVGGATQVEMIEKKHRIEDALEAVKSAQLGGIHAGGGVPLIKASTKVKIPKNLTEEQKIGFNIVLKAVQEPTRQMALNAGMSPDLVVNKIKKLRGARGIDFSTEKVKDLVEEGIIDPVRVTSCALRNAISAASTLITTNYAIIETE